MPRPRKNPSHQQLPKYVYISNGWYIYRPALPTGKLAKPVKLCKAPAENSKVWACYELTIKDNAPKHTLNWLINLYLSSPQFAQRAPKTKAEYTKSAKTVSQYPSKAGLFGTVPVESITPGVIRRYLDARADKPVSANREVAFLSICFSWAVERDLINKNPCKEVRRNTETHRTRYVTDEEYQAVYAIAARWRNIQIAMELAYLCRMRKCEVLALRQSHILSNGLLIERRKGSNDNITLFNDRLIAALKASEALPKTNHQTDLYLVRNQTGDKLTESGFDTQWQRIMAKAAADGIQRFTFHDLKAKGISDTTGDKRTAGGHKSDRMIDVYNRKLAEVKPAGE